MMDVPEIPAGAGLPRDVWDAADEAVEAIVASIWQSEADGVQISWGEARMAVGRAILAERSRCAEMCTAIADREDALAIIKPAADVPLYRHGEKVAQEIERAILS